MKCSKCNSIISDDSRFCNYCGTKIVTEDKLACTNKSCPDFGLHILPVDSRFCPSCGQRIELVNSHSHPSNSTKTFTVNGVSFDMILVTGGTFMMGATPEQGDDAFDNEKPAHRVSLSNYYIGETVVTQALWEAVMGSTVRQQRDKIKKKRRTTKWKLYGEGNNYPMYYINWNECQEFIRRLNTMTGHKFRLPTEAEWEYAARGGNKSRGYKYSGSNNPRDVAWYFGNSGDKPQNDIIINVDAIKNNNIRIHPVATKQPNELGIYDMCGNVWEWCQDWHNSYSGNAQTNPTGPASGSFRVCRGGNIYALAWECRVSYRNDKEGSDWSGATNGLRLALSM